MYLNDHLVNKIETFPSLGCDSCDGLGCSDCPFKKSPNLGDLGFEASTFASTGGTVVGAVTGMPFLGPIAGGIASLFGGGPTKEQKQSGEYYQAALKSVAAHAYFPQTEQEIIEFLQYMTTPVLPPEKYPLVCGTKWCTMKAPCKGAEARGCKFLLPYQVYKSIGGPYSTANPAYDTFGGGQAMLLGQIIPYFQKILDRYAATQGATTGAVESSIGAISNYWPLLLLGGLVYLGSGRRSA